MIRVALLDDYAGVALESANWRALAGKAELVPFDAYLEEDHAAEALVSFDVLCTIRDRMPLPASLLERLPNLKLITTIMAPGANLDLAAASRLGIMVCATPVPSSHRRSAYATPELTWGLLLAAARNFGVEIPRMREGLWSATSGMLLAGKTLGLLGLGRVGKRVARYARAFDMEVIAWSQNLTAAAAEEAGVRLASKEELFRKSDAVSIHLRLSERTRGLVGAAELALMKPTAFLLNTSRGPIVDEAALIAALREHRIAGAGLDTFDREPLPQDHPFRAMTNVIATPHLGYVTRETMADFYGDTLELIEAWLAGAPRHVVTG